MTDKPGFAFWTLHSPVCRSMARLAIDNPRPTPPEAESRALSTRKKGVPSLLNRSPQQLGVAQRRRRLELRRGNADMPLLRLDRDELLFVGPQRSLELDEDR